MRSCRMCHSIVTCRASIGNGNRRGRRSWRAGGARRNRRPASACLWPAGGPGASRTRRRFAAKGGGASWRRRLRSTAPPPLPGNDRPPGRLRRVRASRSGRALSATARAGSRAPMVRSICSPSAGTNVVATASAIAMRKPAASACGLNSPADPFRRFNALITVGCVNDRRSAARGRLRWAITTSKTRSRLTPRERKLSLAGTDRQARNSRDK